MRKDEEENEEKEVLIEIILDIENMDLKELMCLNKVCEEERLRIKREILKNGEKKDKEKEKGREKIFRFKNVGIGKKLIVDDKVDRKRGVGMKKLNKFLGEGLISIDLIRKVEIEKDLIIEKRRKCDREREGEGKKMEGSVNKNKFVEEMKIYMKEEFLEKVRNLMELRGNMENLIIGLECKGSRDIDKRKIREIEEKGIKRMEEGSRIEISNVKDNEEI